MNFVKINIIAIIAGISLIGNIYQYLSKRKIKEYDADKKLKQKRAELEKLEKEYNDMRSGTSASYFTDFIDPRKEERDFNFKKKCLEAEIEYFKKISKKLKIY